MAGIFDDLGLTEPKTMELLGKLREIRAEAYDDLQRAQALNAFLGATRDQVDAIAAMDKIDEAEQVKAADLSELTPEHRQQVEKEVELPLNEQSKIKRMKNDAAISKHGTCVDLLAPMPLDDVKLHDSQSAKSVLKRALETVLSGDGAAGRSIRPGKIIVGLFPIVRDIEI